MISVSFFSKFLKAKVDKKRPLDELKQLVAARIDMDMDGFVGESDLEAFVGRAHYQPYFSGGSSAAGATATVVKGKEVKAVQLRTIQELEENLIKKSIAMK